MPISIHRSATPQRSKHRIGPMTEPDSVFELFLNQTFEGFPDLPWPRMMPGGFFQFEVADVDAAVTLGDAFQGWRSL